MADIKQTHIHNIYQITFGNGKIDYLWGNDVYDLIKDSYEFTSTQIEYFKNKRKLSASEVYHLSIKPQ